MKPAALDVSSVRATDEAIPEQTPRTIEGGTAVETDPFGLFHACTPVGHRVSRGSRGAFTSASGADDRAEQLLISQMQTPERQRAGHGKDWGVMASPLPNIGSPAIFGTPNPVPLFHPSPKRHGLQSPTNASGLEALFQSPLRGVGSAVDLLRFETPSKEHVLESLMSPSPRSNSRRGMATGGQQRRLAAAGWRHGGADAGLGEGQHTFGAGAAVDADFDLVKNLLQSPGPKEVQQHLALQQEQPRLQLRSRAASLALQQQQLLDAAVDAAGQAKPHARRRALDFSKAGAHDLQGLPVAQKGSRHGSTGSATLEPVQHSAAAGQQLDQQQQQDQDRLPDRFQPQLPLLPLDLSECEKHNPSSTTGLTPKPAGAAAAAVRQGNQHQQTLLLDDPFTSPRTTLDAAAAVVAGRAMDMLLNMASSGAEQQQQQLVSNAALRSLTALPQAAFDGLLDSSSQFRAAAAAGLGLGAGDSNKGSLPAMVPLDEVAANAGPDLAKQVQQLLDPSSKHEPHAQEEQGLSQHQQQGSAAAASDQEQDEHDGDDHQSGAAAGPGFGSNGRPLRQAARKQQTASDSQPGRSRRSRRLAGGTPDDKQQTASSAQSGSGGKGRRHASKLAAAAAVGQEAQQQEPEDTVDAMDIDEQPQEELQVQEQRALQDATAAAAADEEADAAEEQPSKPRSKAGGRKGSARKSKNSRSYQRQDECSQQQPDAAAAVAADADADADAAAAAAVAAASLAAQGLDAEAIAGLAASGVDLSALDASGLDASALVQQQYLQSVASLQMLQQGQLQLLQNYGVGPTPDRRGSRAGGLLGPGTPDDVRVAHMSFGVVPMRSCHCKKSQCLKLYCDCFANGSYCSGCACLDCKNVEANAEEVMARRAHIKQRDPSAFTHKLAQRADQLTNRKGCRCKKSHCLKKYCECFQLGVRCGELCKCQDCHNMDGEGVFPMATNTALLQHTAQLQSAVSSQQQQQQQQRVSHAAATTYWPLGPPLPAVSAGAATPSTSVGMAAHAQMLLRLQSAVPGTPGAGTLMSLLQQTPQAAAVAAATSTSQLQGLDAAIAAAAAMASAAAAAGAAEYVDVPGGDSAAADHGREATTPRRQSASISTTPNPPRSAGSRGQSVEGGVLRSTAKPLLPQFMMAAAAAAETSSGRSAGSDAMGPKASPLQQQLQQGSSCANRMQLCSLAAADAANAGDEGELPTPDQAGAEHPLLHMSASPAPAASSGTEDAAAPAASAQQLHNPSSPTAAAAAGSKQQHWGFISSPVTDRTNRQQQQQASPAATCSNSGDGSRAGAAAAAPGSVTSKGRHRLASNSRAEDDKLFAEDLQQQQQQQCGGLAALVAGAAGQAHMSTWLGGQMPGTSNARRQLLQYIQNRQAGAHADSSTLLQAEEQLLLQQQHVAVTPQKPVDATTGGSPGQPVLLGPNGPMVVVPQRALRSAMSQSASLNIPAAAAAAAGVDASSSGHPDDGVPQQTVGMLMTVVDEEGHVQYYFLPSSQAGAGAAAAAAGPHGEQQQPSAPEQPLQQQSQHYALRSRAHKSQNKAHSPMQVDSPPSDSHQQEQHDLPQQRRVTRRQQQQLQTPSKASAADDEAAVANTGAPSRNLRGSLDAGSNPGSARTTPAKRSTPVKRKAQEEDEEEHQPSPAKLLHQVTSPGQQQPATQQVVLSPVKLAPVAGAFTGAGAASNAAGRSPEQQQQQQHHQPLPVDQSQGMQLFLATTADGQQLLLQAPPGTDPTSLIGPDGSIQGCHLAAVLPNGPVAAAQAPGHVAQTAAHLRQQQQQVRPPAHPSLLPQYIVAGQQGPVWQQPSVDASSLSPCRPVPSPREGRPKDSSNMVKFSPGKTVFGPRTLSPTKPVLGNSPGASPAKYSG